MLHTYNLFPTLLSFSLLAPFILRVVLGLIFLNLGWLKLTKEKYGWIVFLRSARVPAPIFITSIFAWLEIIGGLLLLAGAFTQLVALIFTLITLVQLILEYREDSLLRRNFVFYLLLFIVSLSLIFSGAGAYAIDFPLL